MRIVFLGSSSFSLVILKALYDAGHNIVCTICNEDKPVGRGQRVRFSPVKRYAIEKNIPIYQTRNISSKEGEKVLKSYEPDILITASFGQILKENILNLSTFGCFNVHASLLPKYRGATPISTAIINGEKYTGVTIMKTIIPLDAGNIILKRKVKINEDETAGELEGRLGVVGSELLLKALYLIKNKKVKYVRQNEKEATFCFKLKKENSYIDFSKSGEAIQNFCNGLNPRPLARCNMLGEDIEVYKARKIDNTFNIDLRCFKCGDVVLSSGKTGLICKCGDGLVLLYEIKAPNGRKMLSKAYLNGRKIKVKTNLSKGIK